MENPKITLKGKTYTAPPPKVKLWREVTKFKDKFGDKEQGDEEALSEMERLIASAFNHPGKSRRRLQSLPPQSEIPP
jgi:hypothetical protein